MTKITSDLELEVISTTKTTQDILLKLGSDPYTLYHFYSYTSKWQNTRQIKCTTGYSAKGLGWGKDRVRRARKLLLKQNLIEDIVRKDKKGRVDGHFIRLKYAIRNYENILESTLREFQRVENPEGNAYRLINNITSSKEEDNSPSVITDGGIIRRSSPGRHWAIEYWNSLLNPPGIPKHKNPTTKTYKQASRYLTQLHSGTFLNGKPRVRSNLENFFQERRIPFILAERAWSQREILQGLKRLSKVFYLNTQVKSLAALIYNPYSPYKYYSHFFDAFYNYKQVNWRIENKEEEPLEKYVIYIHKKIGDQEED